MNNKADKVNPVTKDVAVDPVLSKNNEAGLYSSQPQGTGLSNGVKVRRRKYVIDRSFQLRYAIMTILFVLFISVALGGIIYVSILSLFIESFGGTGASLVLNRLLADLNIVLFQRILLIVFAGMLAVGAIVILIMHRIVGPIYHLRKTLESIGEGVLPTPIKFRKRDEFHDLATTVNKMLTGLKAMQENNSQLIKDITSSIEKIAEKLRQDELPSTQTLQAVDELTKHLKTPKKI